LLSTKIPDPIVFKEFAVIAPVETFTDAVFVVVVFVIVTVAPAAPGIPGRLTVKISPTSYPTPLSVKTIPVKEVPETVALIVNPVPDPPVGCIPLYVPFVYPVPPVIVVPVTTL